jgi:hypothetical protein
VPEPGRTLDDVCTVIIDIPDDPSGAVRLLAVRDEDPGRPWHPLGEWWPQHPGVVGVHDIRAGGAWLAADPARGRLAILLNRADTVDAPEDQLVSRGSLPLASVTGHEVDAAPRTHGFNLVEVSGATACVRAWDGHVLVTTLLEPGVHMLAHDGVDDPATARIAHWLPEYRAARPAPGDDAAWPQPWVDLLARSAELGPDDDRAIIRDNTPHGYPTESLLFCTATVSDADARVDYVALPSPAHWTTPPAPAAPAAAAASAAPAATA